MAVAFDVVFVFLSRQLLQCKACKTDAKTLYIFPQIQIIATQTLQIISPKEYITLPKPPKNIFC